MSKNKLPEAFIHYVWQTKSFDQNHLKTSEGQTVKILSYGTLNDNAGPDFLQASVKIDDQTWVGNVEIHVNANEWYQHGHQHDKAYDTVILHVVLNNNKVVSNSFGVVIPTIELAERIPDDLYNNYLKLNINKGFIPCERLISHVNSSEIILFQERMMAERLSIKANEVDKVFQRSDRDWKETFHIVLLRAFGLNINKHAFEQLALHTPYRLLEKYLDQPVSCSALFFGQAGFLNKTVDEYTNILIDEYQFLSYKHRLKALSKGMWKFSRMRPSQFPTVRIAQYSALVSKRPKLLSNILQKADIKHWMTLFEVEADSYWDKHYVFNKPSNRISKKLITKATIELLLINAVLPFVFFYGKQKGNEALCQYAIEAFRFLKSENNKIIRSWKGIGISVETGFDTQSLLHLYKNYCVKKKCLQCNIGHKILTAKL